MPIKTILCIEDDRFIGEMYVRNLRKAGFDVDWVVNGNDGLISARNKKYDLMLLDVMLPEQRGTDILKALRGGKQDLIPDTRIIVLTNFEQDDESKAYMQQKVDGYLIKAELTPKKLIQIIQQMG